MAEAKYFKAVNGITDGMVHYSEGDVFAATETITAHYERTGGKNGEDVLYVPISAKEYQATVGDPVGDALVNEDGSVVLGAGAPSGADVVGGGVYADPEANADELYDPPQMTTLPSGETVEVPEGESVESVIKADDSNDSGAEAKAETAAK